jgi:hypothetical protein
MTTRTNVLYTNASKVSPTRGLPGSRGRRAGPQSNASCRVWHMRLVGNAKTFCVLKIPQEAAAVALWWLGIKAGGRGGCGGGKEGGVEGRGRVGLNLCFQGRGSTLPLTALLGSIILLHVELIGPSMMTTLFK